MSSSETHPSRLKGFTLIEALVAVAIFSVVAVIAYQGIGAVSRTKLVLHASQSEFSQLSRTSNLLISDAMYLSYSLLRDPKDGSLIYPLMVQKASSGAGTSIPLSILQYRPSNLKQKGRDGTVRVLYYFKNHTLYRKVNYAPRIYDDTAKGEGQEQDLGEPILNNVEELSIKAMQNPKDKGVSNWAGLSLPLFIKVVLEVKPKGKSKATKTEIFLPMPRGPSAPILL